MDSEKQKKVTGSTAKSMSNSEAPLVKNFSSDTFPKIGIIIFIIAVLGGIATGQVLSSKTMSSNSVNNVNSNGVVSSSDIQKGKIFGSADEKTFKDSAEGVLKEGGVNGEGEYHLERPGGESQNVYLFSSVIDLSQFVNKKVKVWGQTNKAKTAGWLMDVGRLQLQ